MRRDLADQRDVFFFYLAVISYAKSTFKVKKEGGVRGVRIPQYRTW